MMMVLAVVRPPASNQSSSTRRSSLVITVCTGDLTQMIERLGRGLAQYVLLPIGIMLQADLRRLTHRA